MIRPGDLVVAIDGAILFKAPAADNTLDRGHALPGEPALVISTIGGDALTLWSSGTSWTYCSKLLKPSWGDT